MNGKAFSFPLISIKNFDNNTHNLLSIYFYLYFIVGENGDKMHYNMTCSLKVYVLRENI